MKWILVLGAVALGGHAAAWDDEADPLDRPTTRYTESPYDNMPEPCLGRDGRVSDAEVVRGRVMGTFQDDANRIDPNVESVDAARLRIVQHAEVSRVRERCRGGKRARAPRQ